MEKLKKANPKTVEQLFKDANITYAHLWELYRKQVSVEAISRAFSEAHDIYEYPFGSATGVEYRVYLSKGVNGKTYVIEFLVLHLTGGAIEVRSASCNSNSANFREIGRMLDGGYYDEVETLKTYEKNAYRLVLLPNGGYQVYLPQKDSLKEGEQQ